MISPRKAPAPARADLPRRSRFSGDEAQKLLAVGSVLLRKILVAERLEVLDRKTRLFDRPAKDVGVKKIDQVRQSVSPLRTGRQAWVERSRPWITGFFPPSKLWQEFYVVAELRRHHDQIEPSFARFEPAKRRRER